MRRTGFTPKSYEEKMLKLTEKQAKARLIPFSQKKRVAVAKCPNKRLPRAKKQSIATLKKKLWDLCKQTIRKRDGNICVICGKNGLEGSSWHTGHFLPSSVCGVFLRYDLRNLHSSCYNCNINLGGNGAQFYVVLVQNFGQDFVDQLFKDKQLITKADFLFYEKKIKEYQQIQDWDKDKLLNYTRLYTGKDT